ncbi:hypothetical protein HpMS107_51520 [Helicobacter pylori]
MRLIVLAFLLLALSGAVEHFSWYAPLWMLGIQPVHFINGCRIVALVFVVVAVIQAYRLKEYA